MDLRHRNTDVNIWCRGYYNRVCIKWRKSQKRKLLTCNIMETLAGLY